MNANQVAARVERLEQVRARDLMAFSEVVRDLLIETLDEVVADRALRDRIRRDLADRINAALESGFPGEEVSARAR